MTWPGASEKIWRIPRNPSHRAPRLPRAAAADAASPLSPAQAQTALRALRPLLGHLRSAGKDPAAFLRALGIDPACLLDSSARIPFPLLLEAWRRAEVLLDDPGLGLHIIAGLDLRPMERLPHESEWIVLQLFVVSATVGEGLQRFARYFPVGFYGSELALAGPERDRVLHIRHVVPFGCDLPRSFSEFIVGLLIRMLQSFPVRPVHARQIHLRHAAPPSPAEHEQILGASVTFAAAESSVQIDGADLGTPLRVPNPTLAESLERIAREQLAGLAPTESLVEKVRALLVAELPAGNPSAERIAEALQLSVRTLARRLAQHGTSHQALLDEVRARLAQHYLQAERRPVGEVAELLGFAEPSTFHRAFKRWYGIAPTRFRAKAGPDSRG